MRWRATFLTLLLVSAGITGCISTSEPSARAIDGAFPPLPELPELPFRVADQTGLIRAVSVGDPGDAEEGVHAIAGREDALSVLWMGGMCDRRVLVDFQRTADGLALNVATERDFGGCRLAGVFRHLMIELAEPVDAATVSFSMLD